MKELNLGQLCLYTSALFQDIETVAVAVTVLKPA